MWKVSLVGHSQLPSHLSFPDADIRIYRAPGARAANFFNDERLVEVLNWKHDLCILWLGSNDITPDSTPQEVANDVVTIINSIEEECDAIVRVCLVEPRFYEDEEYMSHDHYKRIQSAVNRKLKRWLSNEFIQFNSNSWVENLASDGVHFNSEGKQRIKKRFRRAIRTFIDSDDESS